MSDRYRIISIYSSGIMLNWNDMRTKFGYNLLGKIGFDLGIYHKLNRIRIYSDR
jgi:hypothetical protein